MDHTQNALSQNDAQGELKPYVTPTLSDLGSVAEITQGASGTGADAGFYS